MNASCSRRTRFAHSMPLRNERWDTRSVPRWDTVGAPLGHGGCPTGTRWVPHWDTVRAPPGHGRCPAGTRSVPRWDTVCAPMGHGACPTGVRWVPHWGTVGVPPRHTERVKRRSDSPVRPVLARLVTRHTPPSSGRTGESDLRFNCALRNPSCLATRGASRGDAGCGVVPEFTSRRP